MMSNFLEKKKDLLKDILKYLKKDILSSPPSDEQHCVPAQGLTGRRIYRL